MRFWLAIQVFFKVLFNGQFAKQLNELATGANKEVAAPQEKTPPAPQKKESPKLPARGEAITLLATLQREARFVDLVKEQLSDYSDEQVGAAARDVLRDCGKVLDRMFAIEPIEGEEGSEIETPATIDAGRYRLTGNVSGEPPFRGRVVHHGWQATRCELPVWSGSDESSRVVAPVEVEL